MSITVDEVLKKIINECNDFNEFRDYNRVDLKEKIPFNEYQVNSIVNVIKYFISHSKIDLAKETFKNIFKKPIKKDGHVYEALVYGWFIDNYIYFDAQVDIDKSECLKNNDYKADGKLLEGDGSYSNVIFDVKAFGIGFPHINTLRDKIEERLQDKIITIEGLSQYVI